MDVEVDTIAGAKNEIGIVAVEWLGCLASLLSRRANLLRSDTDCSGKGLGSGRSECHDRSTSLVSAMAFKEEEYLAHVWGGTTNQWQLNLLRESLLVVGANVRSALSHRASPA